MLTTHHSLVAPQWEGAAACATHCCRSATNGAGIVQGTAAPERQTEHVCQDVTARTAPAITRLPGSTRPEKVQQKDRSGPKNALYLHSQYLLQLPWRPLLQQTHAHVPHQSRKTCRAAALQMQLGHTQLLARDAFPASVNRKQQQLWGPGTGLHVQLCSDEPQPQNPSYKHTISCSSTVNTCSPSQSCQQRAQGDKLLRKDAAVGVQCEDSKGTQKHTGDAQCVMGQLRSSRRTWPGSPGHPRQWTGPAHRSLQRHSREKHSSTRQDSRESSQLGCVCSSNRVIIPAA